ncbi:MAG: YidC/Oxa1 family membrane protein insertase [Rhodospirillaceae bacterium]|nr:YidC/Oxa1 family membrane protein insertase [Rhodospirillaceae bacterium]
MTLNVLKLTLGPIIWLMGIILDLYISVIGSIGASVLLLSFTFTLLVVPFRKRAQELEARISSRTAAVNLQVVKLKKEMKGEKLFLATEKVYGKYGYHPIQSIGQGASFFVMLPILVSAIFLLSDSTLLGGEKFLFISDLSAPDGLLYSVNILPIIMTGITIIDARLRFGEDAGARYKFYGIAIVLLVLVYDMPSGLVLYWTGSNILSFVQSRISSD